MFKRICIGILGVVLSSLCIAQNVKTYIPPQAFDYRDNIYKELMENFSELYEFNYVPALIEHESCIGLKHSKCWNSRSKLSTKRELGVGLGQITKAYNTDGSVRFDKLTELRNQYREELREVSWGTIENRPDLQIRMIVLMIRDDYKKLYAVKDLTERLKMTDAAYNGGYGGLTKERRACALAEGCDQFKWTGNVERYCLKSKKALYGGRSACDINRHHVKDVFDNRLGKYKKEYFNMYYFHSKIGELR